MTYTYSSSLYAKLNFLRLPHTSVGGNPFVAGDASRLVCLDGSADCDGVDSAGVLDSVLAAS